MPGALPVEIGKQGAFGSNVNLLLGRALMSII